MNFDVHDLRANLTPPEPSLFLLALGVRDSGNDSGAKGPFERGLGSYSGEARINYVNQGRQIFISAIVIVLVYAYGITHIDAQSLWFDEAWSVYAVRNPPPATFEPPRGLRSLTLTPARAAYTDVTATLNRVREDVHPPLYFLLLDGWVWLTGESVFALRYLSLLVGLVGAAALYWLACDLFGGVAGRYALLLYGTAVLFVAYTQEARMYTLLMTLAVASTAAYRRLVRAPSRWRVGLYAVAAALALYTHYAAALVLLAHGLHILLTRRGGLLALVAAAALFTPYLPVVWGQLVANPGGALAAPIATDFAAVRGLWLMVTGGWGWLYALVLAAAGVAAVRVPVWRSGLLLVTLWLFITPFVLLAANAAVMPLFQVRYVLGALPALVLLLAAGLALLHQVRWGRWGARVAFAGMVVAQITAQPSIIPPKPDYDSAIAAASAARDPLAPIITDIAPRDPVRYYAPRYNLTAGPSVDLSWRDHTAEEVATIVKGFEFAPTVWTVLPVNVAKTWYTVAALQAQGRTPGYAANVENMVIYSWARDGSDPLAFTFEDAAEQTVAMYTVEVGAGVTAQAGKTVCVPVALAVEREATAFVTLVGGYNEVITAWQGDPHADEACINVPADAPPGEYAVYLALFDGDGTRYPVMHANVWWGWWVVSHRLTVVP